MRRRWLILSSGIQLWLRGSFRLRSGLRFHRRGRGHRSPGWAWVESGVLELLRVLRVGIQGDGVASNASTAALQILLIRSARCYHHPELVAILLLLLLYLVAYRLPLALR